MTNLQKPPKKTTPVIIRQPKLVAVSLIGFFLLSIAVHFFVTLAVFPHIEIGSFVVEVPAKTGGSTYFVSQEEFQTLSLVAMSVSGALAALGLFILSRENKTVAALFVYLLSVSIGSYAAVMAGNGFYELWRGWWSVLGVLIAIVITITLGTLTVNAAYAKKGASRP